MVRRGVPALLAGVAGLVVGWLGAATQRGAVGDATAPHEEPHAAAAAAAGGQAADLERSFHFYLCAFHVAKADPSFQLEAHHYCEPAGGDVHQCVVYDRRGPGARLLGTEYIIADAVYRGLPDAEKAFWHPHAYEVLSGQLVAPGLPEPQETDLLRSVIRTWGKTWHTWPDPAQPLPLGAPRLMWSINGDGQLDPALLERRDRAFGISTPALRQRRRSAYGYAVPQLPPPATLEAPGRQFTADGPDEPPPPGRD
jgi:hypothetical protein